jgi:CBS domain-containing protein
MPKHITSSPSYIKYSKGATRSFEEPYICDAEYILSEVKGIRGPYHKKLRHVGLVTTKDLLKRCRTDVARESYAKEMDIDPFLLLKWTKMADLMRVEGIGQQSAELLMLAGIDSMKKLARSEPLKLLEPLHNPGKLPVKNLRIDDEYDVIEGTANLRRAARIMVEKNLPDLVVCNSKKPKGILTFRSIVRAVAEDQDMDQTQVQEVIVKDTPILSPTTTIEKAAEMLIDVGLPVLPVVEQGELMGVVSRLDIEDVFLKISQRRPSQEEVQRWITEAKRHKPISIH